MSAVGGPAGSGSTGGSGGGGGGSKPQLFAGPREQLAALWARGRDAFEQRPQRERTLIVAGFLTMVGFTFAVTVLLVMGKLDDMETHNSQVTDALRLLAKNGTLYRSRKRAEQSLDAVLSHTPPALLKFVDEVATKTQVKIGESKELNVVPRGDKYQSRGLELKLREVDLPQLVAFLKEVEGSTHKIVVERLAVKPRYGQHEKLDVELTVAAFEKAEKKKKSKSEKGSSSRRSADAGDSP
jgi:hypothetical protein